MEIMRKIKREYNKIDKDALYSTEQIVEMGLIVDTNLKSSIFTIYRLIRAGKLKSTDIGSGGAPRYFVKGIVLKKFIKNRYSL